MIAWGKGGVYQYANSYYNDTFVSRTVWLNSEWHPNGNKADTFEYHTLTFKKSCKGYFMTNGGQEVLYISGGDYYTTITLNEVFNAQGTYTDKIYTFSAQAGQKLCLKPVETAFLGYTLIGN